VPSWPTSTACSRRPILKAGSYRVSAQGVGFRQKAPVIVDVPRTKKTKLVVEREDAPPTGAIAGASSTS
jgi:hypothetical protein